MTQDPDMVIHLSDEVKEALTDIMRPLEKCARERETMKAEIKSLEARIGLLKFDLWEMIYNAYPEMDRTVDWVINLKDGVVKPDLSKGPGGRSPVGCGDPDCDSCGGLSEEDLPPGMKVVDTQIGKAIAMDTEGLLNLMRLLGGGPDDKDDRSDRS